MKMKLPRLLAIGLSALLLHGECRAQCNITAPVITVSQASACEITISWNSDVNVVAYKVKYRIKGQSTWLENLNVGLNTTYIATGLAGNKKYIFNVTPYCSNHLAGATGAATVTTPGCSKPDFTTVSSIDNTSATISWSVCGISAEAFVRFKIKGNNPWTTLSAGQQSSLTINTLLPNTKYQYQVNTCDSSDKKLWSTTTTFTTLEKPVWQPNVLVIYLDDCRYDVFAPNRGPAYFNSPAINSLAEEGANFRWCFPAFSLCQPSRASIVSGLYPHHHGVYSNANVDTFAHATIAEIMHDAGYYTGFVGKYAIQLFPVPGYDYYCQSNSDEYWDAQYQDNQKPFTTIWGHKTEVFTDRALKFLQQVPPGKKFMLLLAHKAPHVPYDPRLEDEGLFDNDTMPFPSNYSGYTANYPSHYTGCDLSYQDSTKIASTYNGYFELLNGAEWSVDTILNYLRSKNLLDSTLIIFSSDNGLLIGEHELGGKELVLEPSIQLPMFIRFPKWFSSPEVISDEMSMNIDIAPTILDAAGIPDTFNMDGVSMHRLASGEIHRKELFYEYFNRYNCNPTFQAVRDFSYKYVRNECSSFSEEFYDLINDPLETENLINAPNYASLVALYKLKLDSLEEFYDYTNIRDTVVTCSLVHPDSSVINFRLIQSTPVIDNVELFPNPVGQRLTLSSRENGQGKVHVIITDIFSRVIFERDLNVSGDPFEYQVDVSAYPAGTYLLSLKSEGRKESHLFVKQ